MKIEVVTPILYLHSSFKVFNSVPADAGFDFDASGQQILKPFRLFHCTPSPAVPRFNVVGFCPPVAVVANSWRRLIDDRRNPAFYSRPSIKLFMNGFITSNQLLVNNN